MAWLSRDTKTECLENAESNATNMGLILLILVLILLFGAWPRWGYNQSWGYGPVGGLGLILLIIVIVLLFSR